MAISKSSKAKKMDPEIDEFDENPNGVVDEAMLGAGADVEAEVVESDAAEAAPPPPRRVSIPDTYVATANFHLPSSGQLVKPGTQLRIKPGAFANELLSRGAVTQATRVA